MKGENSDNNINGSDESIPEFMIDMIRDFENWLHLSESITEKKGLKRKTTFEIGLVAIHFSSTQRANKYYKNIHILEKETQNLLEECGALNSIKEIEAHLKASHNFWKRKKSR